MAKWKHTIKIGDLHQAYQDNKISIKEVAASLANRLKKLKIDDLNLLDIIDRFEFMEDVADYDDALEELYNWADKEHILWIDCIR